jgi:hypothetical protein
MVAAGAGFGTITAFINVFLLSTLCMAWLLPETEGHRLD